VTDDPARTLVPTLIARSVVLDDDGVNILDRRTFPFERTWVHCATTEEVARAIEEMVTQSSGPFFAAAGGMALAGREADRRAGAKRLEVVEQAAHRLVATRPTNNHIRDVVDRLLAVARAADADQSLGRVLEDAARAEGDAYLSLSRDLGEQAADLINDGDAVLTHCWGESYVTEAFAAAIRQGKRVTAVVTETRPYLQGARLTAESLGEIGVETTVITDNMGAWAMHVGRVATYVTAADRVTMDGHVINKVGTFQLALAADHHRIPYYALIHAPDPQSPDMSTVTIEERDPEEVLYALGMRTASHRARGWYPAFDVTPPNLVSAVVTSRGRYSPYDLASHFSAPSEEDQR